MTLIAAVAAAVVGFAAVYEIFPVPGNGAPETRTQASVGALGSVRHQGASPSREGTGSVASSAVVGSEAGLTARLKPFQTGDMVKFVVREPAVTPRPITFNGPDGKALSLDDFRGRYVLLNLWATWCAPCLKEMPDLARLQRELGSDTFEVVAVSIDRGSPKKPLDLLNKLMTKAELPLDTLAFYHDPKVKINTDLDVYGMPTTVLFNPEGNEIGRLVGPAKWDAEDAVRLIRAAMGTEKAS